MRSFCCFAIDSVCCFAWTVVYSIAWDLFCSIAWADAACRVPTIALLLIGVILI